MHCMHSHQVLTRAFERQYYFYLNGRLVFHIANFKHVSLLVPIDVWPTIDPFKATEQINWLKHTSIHIDWYLIFKWVIHTCSEFGINSKSF